MTATTRQPSAGRGQSSDIGKSRLATLGAFLSIVTALSACQDPNRMFTGLWEAEFSVSGASWIQGRPELAIGHFGTELTGVIRYLDDNALPTLACRCAFLDHQRVDLDSAHFIAISEQCDGALWIWDLSLDEDAEDPLLVGTITRADDPDSPVSFSARLADRFIPDERRKCTP